MQHERFTFVPTIVATDIQTVDGGPTHGSAKFSEDVFIKNGVVVADDTGQGPLIIPRPGFKTAGVGTGGIVAGATEGRGCYTWNGNTYYCVDSTIYKGTSALTGNLTTSTGLIHWEPSLAANGILLFHDGAHLYSIDSSDVIVRISADAWVASTVYAAGDYVTSDTDKVYICTQGGTSDTPTGPVGTSSGINDNTCIWDYVKTVTGGSNIPSAMVSGLVVVDQYVFVGQTNGNIFNSNVGDPYTWTAGDQLNAETLPDNLVGIARYSNYLVALGEFSTEFFYNAANVNGSPFSRMEGTFLFYGCVNGDTVAPVGDNLYWLGRTQTGGVGFVELKGFQAEFVSPEAVGRVLQEYKNYAVQETYYMRLYGRDLVLVTASSSAAASTDGYTMVYDVSAKTWYSWEFDTFAAGSGQTSFPFRGFTESTSSETERTYETMLRVPGNGGTADILQYYTGDLLYRDVQDDGTVQAITCTIRTQQWDAGNSFNKFVHAMSMVGDNDAGNHTVSIQWEDEDSDTLSTARNLNSTTTTGKDGRIWRCGSCKRRRFQLTYQNDGESSGGISGLDIYYTQGNTGGLE